MDSKTKKVEPPKKTFIKFNEHTDSDIIEYQNVNQFLKHLPHFDKIKANALSEFERIRLNLSKTIALNEIRPGLVHWTNRLQTYVNEYGLFFSKEDHVKLIKIYLEIIFTRNIDLTIVDLCFSILIELLK
jgi:proteasome activator subunit 4